MDFIADLYNENSDAFERKTFAKGDLLVKSNTINTTVFFVKSGACRVYLSAPESIHTIRFGYEGSIVAALDSFVNNTPTIFEIEAIRKTTVDVVSKEVFEHFMLSSHSRLLVYNDFLKQLIIQQMEREVDLLILSPTERLQRVLERSPQLFQHVPLKYIASYLRMSPETLSRIRKS